MPVSMRMTTEHDYLGVILRAAEAHGICSEPDHEIGDLRAALELAWSLLTSAQRLQVYESYRREHEMWLETDLSGRSGLG
jgi:hypothetical protein